MFRNPLMRLAAKSLVGDVAAVAPASVATSRAIARILASSAVAAFPGTVAESAVQKTKGEGAAGAAALLGRSQILISKRQDLTSVKVALADADAAVKATAGSASPLDVQLNRLALVTRTRIFNILLDEQESLFANGAAKEADVSTARGLVRAAYADLVAASPNDSLALLGSAEFELYEGNAQRARELFEQVECLLAGEAASKAAKDVSAAGSIAYRFRAAVNASNGANGTLASKVLEQTRADIATGKSVISDADVAALRAQLGTETSLSQEELSFVAIVVDAAESGVHPGEFFPLKEGYNAWSSSEASSLHNTVRQFVEGEAVSVSDSTVSAIRSAKHNATYFASEADLKKVISGDKSGDVLAAIEQAFGAGPTSVLSSHDVAFQEALRAIDIKSEEPSTTVARLRRQIGLRATVNKAIALDRLNQPHEALALLDSVISGNEYIYMWKAFLARGRIRQNLGLVADGDADFKSLFSLRSPYAKVDIPLRDEYRTKSVF